MIVVNYQDIADIRLKRGIIHTDIFLKSRFHTDEITVSGANNNVAEKANALIQQGVRGEHKDQQSPNYNYYYGGSGEESELKDVESKIGPVRKLAELADLKQKGILTEDEFQRLKIRLLEKI
jgi:hypothetical protein